VKRSAVGLFVKCGKAIAVLLEVSNEPQVIDRRMITLADPSIPDSIQPFHVFETKSGQEAEQLVKKLKKVVAKVSANSVKAMLSDYRKMGYSPDRAALVVGSTIDPDKLKNEHIRWHALEGQLFRTSVENALLVQNLKCSIVLFGEVYKKSSELLKKKEEVLKNIVKELGHDQSPWRSEEKAASIAAWMSCVRKI
jgi:hypothetical protein